jgi:hypothetical protein
MTDQTEVKDASSNEVAADAAVQTEQTEPAEEGSSLKDKVEHAVDTVKDKLTGGDKDSDADSDAVSDSKE